MTYAPGEEADEKLHAAHHAKLVQGIRFSVSTDSSHTCYAQHAFLLPTVPAAQHDFCITLASRA